MKNGHKELLTFPVSITCPYCNEEDDYCEICEGTGEIEEDPNDYQEDE